MTTAMPVEVGEPATEDTVKEDRPWVVVVWNDPINLISYVTLVLQKLFGYNKEKATQLTMQVHNNGRAAVSAGTREQVELEAFKLHEYGLWATVEEN